MLNNLVAYIGLLVFLFLAEEGFAQRKLCGTPLYFSQSTSDYAKRLQNNRADVSILSTQRTLPDSQVAIIPVVFHIVRYNDFGTIRYDIPDARVTEQIEILNNDFRRVAGTLGFNTSPLSTDAKIEFRLANRDPAGNPTNGIVRVLGNRDLYSFDEDVELKSLSQWDPARYLNIWVCNLNDLLGYAQFPITNLPGPPADVTTPNTDGVVLLYTAIGRSGPNNFPYNLGRTATHEIGHYLGLFHIWGDEDDCSGSDFCNDTPPQAGAIFNCPSTRVSCSFSNMIANYMNYSNDNCVNIFTRDQIGRMRYVLANSPFRTSLLTSNGFVTNAQAKFDAPEVSVFPNPVERSDILKIELSSEADAFKQVRVLNMLGQEQFTLNEFDSPTVHSLAVNNWAKGVYLLQISTLRGDLVKKVMLR